MKKTLCILAREKNIEELKKLAVGARYICPVCFRVSNDPQRICCKAVEIASKEIVKDFNCCDNTNCC